MFSRVYFLYKIECMEITHYESHPLPYHNAHTVKKMEYSHGTNFNRNAAILSNFIFECKIKHSLCYNTITTLKNNFTFTSFHLHEKKMYFECFQ